MTERKRPGQSWESWIDQQIREAREEGAFDNLPGAGKPLSDLNADYDPLWWTKKLIQREQVSALPPALELRRTVERTLEQLQRVRDESEVRRIVEALNAQIRKLNATAVEGPATSLAPFDVEAVLDEWRRRSAAR
jgi:DnaJ-like protein